MNCFIHHDKNAIGICKNCNKALCEECAIDTGSGIACKGKCEKDVKDTNELVEFNMSRVKQLKKSGRFVQIMELSMVGQYRCEDTSVIALNGTS